MVLKNEGYSDIIKAVFLLILAIIGGKTGKTLGCKIQKLLNENMFAKHVTLFMIIYFAMDISKKQSKSPLESLKGSLFIYIMFLLFTKMNLYSSIIVFILLGAVYLLNSQIAYLEENNKENNKSEIQIYNKINKLLYIIIPIIIIISFVFYFIKQRKDHAKNWSSIKFVFGSIKCKNN